MSVYPTVQLLIFLCFSGPYQCYSDCLSGVLEVPKVIDSSDKKDVKAQLNLTVTFWCLISASTISGVTDVVWIKDKQVISNSSHRIIITQPSNYKPVLKTTYLTNLTIVSITAKDNGVYSCQAFYNRDKVMSRDVVSSEPVFFTINKGTVR